MSNKVETLKNILETTSSLFSLNDFYSRDMLYWEDENKNILSISPACKKITGYTSEEFMNNSKLIEEIVFTEDLEIWKNRCQDVHRDDVDRIQFRIRHKSGKTVWLEHDAQKLYNSKGSFIGFRSSNRDITKRKYTNEIIDSSSSVLFLWKNEEGYPVEFVSSNVENVLGYTIEEFTSGKVSYGDIVHPLFKEKVKSEINYNIKAKDKNFKHELYKVITKDDRTIWVSDKTIVKTDSNNNITHFHGIVSDVTKQVEAEQALKDSEQRLSLSQEAANVGSWELDVASGNLYWSDQIEPLFGFKKEEFKGTYDAFLELIHVDDREKVNNAVNASLKNDALYKIEHRIVWHDGTVRWMLEQGKVQRDFENNPIKMYGTVRDITERVSLFNKIKSSEEQYKSLIEFSPNGIVIHSKGKILYANAMAILLIKGSASKDYTGSKISDFIHADFLEEIVERLKNVSEGLRTRAFLEMKFNCLDDTTIDVAVASAIIKYKGEVAIQTVFYDTTKAKKVQSALRKSEEVYRNVFNYSPLGILHFDKNGIITDCNDGFASIIGTTKERLIGFNMLVKLTDVELKEAIKKSLISGSGYYKNKYTSLISSKTSPVIGRFNAIYSDEKEIIGGVGLIEDITDRTKHDKLQKALFDISETASKIISIKELYQELHGIIKKLMPAENLYIAMHNSETNLITFPYFVDEKDENPKSQVFGNGFTEYILRKKSNEIITTQIENELVKNGDVNDVGTSAAIWVGIYLEFEGNYKGVLALQDYEDANAYNKEDVKVLEFVSAQIIKVLDKKYADRRLRESVTELIESKRELEIINENKDRFFSIIAHDLRAPFNTLLGVTELISGDMDDMSMREVKEISSVIHSSTNNLFKLIENLLNWSRLQMGTFNVNPKVLSVNEMVLDTLEILKYSAKEKNISIENKIMNYEVFADEECFKTVLRNLINNAIKFTHRNGSIMLDAEELKTHIKISVNDNGVGISEETAEKLFSITSKTSTVGTENEKGTGLGLILCKDLIEKNNGKIWIESKYAKGSNFSFTLPKE